MSNVVHIHSDQDLVAMLEHFTEMAREAKLVGVVLVYENDVGNTGFHTLMTPKCRASTLVGELSLALHVTLHNEAVKAGLHGP